MLDITTLTFDSDPRNSSRYPRHTWATTGVNPPSNQPYLIPTDDPHPIHFDRFNHGHAPFLGAFAFWGWTIVYIISPLAVFAIWWTNRATDRREPVPGDPVLSDTIRLAARTVGLGALIVAAVFFISPTTAINIWPWKLTPLTARVIASFTAQVGVGAMVVSLDSRWSGWRLIVQTFFVATAFLLVGAARAWEDFNHDDVTTYLYVGGLLAADVALLVLYNSAERRARAHAPH